MYNTCICIYIYIYMREVRQLLEEERRGDVPWRAARLYSNNNHNNNNNNNNIMITIY